MDFDAHYTKLEAQQLQQSNEKVICGYNQKVEIVKVIIERIIEQAKINPPDYYVRIDYLNTQYIAWPLWSWSVADEKHAAYLLTDGRILYQEDGNYYPIELEPITERKELPFSRVQYCLSNIIDSIVKYGQKHFGIEIDPSWIDFLRNRQKI